MHLESLKNGGVTLGIGNRLAVSFRGDVQDLTFQ